MRPRVLLALVLAATGLTCQSGDSGGIAGGCPSGQTCGFDDHKYFSTYYCGGMGIGYSWRDQTRCVEQCQAAAAAGCEVTTCDCSADHGTGNWFPCTADNGGQQSASNCFLSGSGLNGETVPCVCR